jgi:hypothetical protein
MGRVHIKQIYLRKDQSGNLMQRVGLASFGTGVGLYLVLASFRVGRPIHLRERILAARPARQYRDHAMAGTITPVYRCQESLPIRGTCVTHRACPARARWGKNDRSVTRPAESLLGRAPAIGTCPGRHSAVCCRATGHQSSFNYCPLGKTLESRVV